MIPRIESDDTTETRTRLPPSQDATEGAATPADAGVPASIDRFRVIRQIGVGGMGTVFEAFDPELDRKIAVKLLAGEHGPEETESKRLLREARSLAQISHPNVVEIYGAGIDDGRVWLAMELVEGRTLKQWAAENPPGTDAQRDAAVDLLRQAAAGLSAAHARGMTHRDFKPANALVGSDGRVRVVDFGLAVRQLAPGEKDLAKSLPDESSSALRTYDDAITRTGAVLGTPRYMAPEQHRGEPATPRTDQFAFAVTAWELLYGEPPFELVSVAAIYDAIVSRSFREPASQSVPRWMNRVLRKALSPVPARRYRTMDALVRALEGRTRRRRIAGVAFATALSSTALLARNQPGKAADSAEICDRTAGGLFDDVWTADAKARILAAVEATNVPFAADVETTLDLAIDRYRVQWVTAASAACTSNIRGLSEGSCIDQDLQVFKRLVADAENMTPTKAERLDSLFNNLPPPSRCVGETNLPATRGAPAVTRRISDATIAYAVGDRERAEELTLDLLSNADSWNVRVDALILLGRLRLQTDLADAIDAWEQAYELAIEHNASILAAEAAWRLALGYGSKNMRDTAEAWESRHNAEASRVENWSGRSKEELRCLLLEGADEYKTALPWCQAALRTTQSRDPLGVRRKQIQTSLANLYARTGNLQQALEIQTDLYDSSIERVGPDHPATAGMLLNLGITYSHLGQHEEAAKRTEQARRVFTRAYGADNRWSISAAMNASGEYLSAGMLDKADETLSRVIPLMSTSNIDSAQTARVLTNLAGIRIKQQRYAESIELLARVRGLQSSELRPEDPQIAHTYAAEMWSYVGLHRFEDALTAANASIDIRVRTGEDFELLEVLRGRILVFRRLERLDDARADVQRGLERARTLDTPAHLGLFHLSGALVEFDAGNLDAAARHMDLAATEVDPEAAPEGQAGLRFLQARLAYERGDDQPTALEAAKATLADLETSPLLFFPLEEARAWVEEANLKSR